MQLQDDYFTAYHNLKLTRDANGVLVVRISQQRRAVHYDRTSSYGVCRCLLPDRAGSSEQDRNPDGSRRGLHYGRRLVIFRQRRRSRRLEPGSRRRRSGFGKHSQHTCAGHRGYRGTRPCALRLCAACQCDCGGRGCDLPGCGRISPQALRPATESLPRGVIALEQDERRRSC